MPTPYEMARQAGAFGADERIRQLEERLEAAEQLSERRRVELKEEAGKALRFGEENERLRADQTDWRKGVELIASALGEHSPPNLDCVRISRLALEQRARIEAALAEAEDTNRPDDYRKLQRVVKALKGEGKVGDPMTAETADAIADECLTHLDEGE